MPSTLHFPHSPRLHRFFLSMPVRYGVARTVVAFAVVMMSSSIALTALINLLAPWTQMQGSLVVAAVVPTVLAPPICWVLISLILALDRAQATLRHVADRDVLTDAFTRRYFIRSATQQLERDAKLGRDDSVVLLDIDDFKQINDRFGHPTGDAVLREISMVCRRMLREHDVFARYGGEEFVILLPGATPSQAQTIVERMRVAISGIDLRAPSGEQVPVSASFGIAGSRGKVLKGPGRPPASPLDGALAAADSALYVAKRGGKNRSVVMPDGEAVMA